MCLRSSKLPLKSQCGSINRTHGLSLLLAGDSQCLPALDAPLAVASNACSALSPKIIDLTFTYYQEAVLMPLKEKKRHG